MIYIYKYFVNINTVTPTYIYDLIFARSRKTSSQHKNTSFDILLVFSRIEF